MTTSTYRITKILNGIAALCLLVVGGLLFVLSLVAIYHIRDTVSPAVALLLVPGIVLLVLSAISILSFLRLKQHHPNHLHYPSIVFNIVVIGAVLCYIANG
jgi:drug/metabolite transporter (DMT)-like permease